MAARDTLVICSDGLSDNVSTDEMIELLRTGPLQSGCEDVVTLARERMQRADEMLETQGKPDDLTFLACRPSTGRSNTAAAVNPPAAAD